MIKPKLALIPSSYKGGSPKGTLYSVLPSDGAGDFDFERAGEATRINKDGLIETVDSNVPRLNYPLIDGVVSGCPSFLLEPSRTNLLQYSEEFSNAYWNKSLISVTANDSISPDGTQNTDKIVGENSTGSLFFRRTSLNYSATDNTFSIFAKFTDDLFEQFHFVIFDGTNHFAYFDVKNGSVVSTDAGVTATIENYGNGWYRCIATYQTTSTTGGQIKVELGDSVTQTGDEISGMLFWGLQWEVGSYATSYIATTSATATRSAETCNNSGDVNTFNDSEGVLMAEVNFENNDTDKGISISDGTSSNRVLFYLATGGNLYGQVFNGVGSIPIVTIIDTNFQINLTAKLAIKYKQNDFSFWVNGIKIGAETIGNTFSSGVLDQLSFTESGASANPFYGNTKQIQYFDKALTDTDLEELTSWRSFNEMARDLLYTIL